MEQTETRSGMNQEQYDHCGREIGHIMEHIAQVLQMVRGNREYSDILVELAKARSAVSSLSKEMLSIHVEGNLDDLVSRKDPDHLLELEKLIMTYVK